MLRLLTRLLALLSASAAGYAFAHDQPSVEDRGVILQFWDTPEGLPQASATAMVQSRDGFLWFGTFEGLVRFDGVRFEVFDRTRCPALPSNAVIRLMIDRKDRLWIGTDRGVAILDNGVVRAPPAGAGPTGRVESIVEDAKGRVLVSGVLSISLFDGEKARFLNAPGAPSGQRIDTITLASSDGRVFAERGKKIFLLGALDHWAEVTELEGEVLALGARRAGGVFAADERGLYAIDTGLHQLVAALEPRGQDYGYLDETLDGTVWLSSHIHGVTEYRVGKEPRRWGRAEGLRQDSVRFVFQDSEDNTWIGTDGAGLVQMRKSSFSTYGAKDGLRETIVRAVLEEAPGRLLVATHGGGVVRFEDGKFSAQIETSTTALRLDPSPLWAWALMRARDGAVWVGFCCGGGVARLDGEVVRRPRFPPGTPPTVRSIAQDESGTVWLATEGGLFRAREDGSEPLQPVAIGDSKSIRATSLLARSGAVWVGTEEDGLWSVGQRGAERVAKLEQDRRGVVALAEDARGAVWISLEGGYLVRWQNGQVRELGPSDGLPRARIRGIACDGKRGLWMATSQGVARLDLDSVDRRDARPTIMRLDVESGLPNREVNAVLRISADRQDGGDLVFATLSGLAVLTPASMPVSSSPPHVLFERLTLVDRTGKQTVLAVGGPARIEVEPQPSHVALSFTSPAFVRPEDVVFDLEVEGPDHRSHHELRARTFELLHPAPGSYRFRLSATDRFGTPAAAPAELTLIVAPLFWQTLWFRGSASLVALATVGLAVALLYRRRLRAAHENLEREQKLRESEEGRRELLETSQSPIWVLDASGRWQMMTRAAELIFGAQPNQMIGRPFLASSADEAHDRAFLEELAATGKSADHLTQHKRLDGARVHLRFKAVVRRDALSQVVGYAGTVVDVTEEHRAREERERVERRMVETQRLESLGQLAGGIAHDFNNMLTAIGLNVEHLAAQRGHDRDTEDAIATIQNVTQRAAGLCRQMLAFSGRGRFEMVSIDLSALAESTAALVRACAPPDVKVDVEARSKVPPISGDPSQIGQVLMNLVLNGAEAIGKRAGRVVTRLSVTEGNDAMFQDAMLMPKDPNRRFVTITVSDNGCGMNAETMSSMFDPFFSTKSTGRGLGLAAVLGIVRGHGGALRVSSEVGRGTEFLVWFPAEEDRPRPIAVITPARLQVPVGACALVADDEEMVRTTLVRILSRRGIEVVQCANGREAVDAFEPHRFSIVFLDLTMPVMGGLDAITQIRERWPAQRVVLMSGYDASDASAHPGSKLAMAFMHKPFKLEDVDRILRMVFENRPPS